MESRNGNIIYSNVNIMPPSLKNDITITGNKYLEMTNFIWFFVPISIICKPK